MTLISGGREHVAAFHEKRIEEATFHYSPFFYPTSKCAHIIINKRTFPHISLASKNSFRCKARQVIAFSGDISNVFNALFIKTSIHFGPTPT